jgi:uncharacterized membrane protein
LTGYRVSTTIAAPIDLVWRVLTDVERMPDWTASMRSVRLVGGGNLHRGSRVHIRQPWLPAASWTVELFDPPRHFSWRSRTGPIDTVGSHLLEECDRTTIATFTIQHHGPGARVVALRTAPITRRHVGRELSGLRARAEHVARPDAD